MTDKLLSPNEFVDLMIKSKEYATSEVNALTLDLKLKVQKSIVEALRQGRNYCTLSLTENQFDPSIQRLMLKWSEENYLKLKFESFSGDQRDPFPTTYTLKVESLIK